MKNFKTMLLLTAFVAVFAACKKDDRTEQVLAEPKTTADADAREGLMCIEKYPGVHPRGATETVHHWPNGSKIKVSLNGSAKTLRDLKDKVIQYASQWEQYANIDFDFVTNDATAPIRVAFLRDGHWSYIGTYAQNISSSQPTMNLEINSRTSATELSRVILHEFGHALGMIHEHQHPQVTIPWDKEKVYADLGGYPNYWSRETVDFNLFATYTTDETTFGAYDKSSIMHYPIDESWTIGTFSVGNNNVLSATDKSFIATVYPK